MTGSRLVPCDVPPTCSIPIQTSESDLNIATYNEGLLEWADCDYTVLMSADDRLTPGALRRAADLLDSHPDVGFVYGHPVHFQHGQEPPPARTTVRGWSIWPG